MSALLEERNNNEESNICHTLILAEHGFTRRTLAASQLPYRVVRLDMQLEKHHDTITKKLASGALLQMAWARTVRWAQQQFVFYKCTGVLQAIKCDPKQLVAVHRLCERIRSVDRTKLRNIHMNVGALQ